MTTESSRSFWIEFETTIPGRTLPAARGSELRRRTFCSRSDLTYGEKLREGGLDRSSYRRQFSSYP